MLYGMKLKNIDQDTIENFIQEGFKTIHIW